MKSPRLFHHNFDGSIDGRDFSSLIGNIFMRSDNLSYLSVPNSYKSQNISVIDSDDTSKLAISPSAVRTVRCMMYLESACRLSSSIF